MNHSITVQFQGSLKEFQKWLPAMFNRKAELDLNVTLTASATTPETLLIKALKALQVADPQACATAILKAPTAIDAIKILRTAANLGLKESKDAIEGFLTAGLVPTAPWGKERAIWMSR